jgi:S-adenosylmethionine decarboxylase
MSNAFSHFHPNPGWSGSRDGGCPLESATILNGNIEGPSNVSIVNTVGKHCILELYDCDCARLDDEDFLRSAISNAALRAGATLLQLISHRFQPHGVTGLALLAESHISIHTWPESGYAAVDVFTCGDHTMPETACRVLVDELRAEKHILRSFRRETPDMVADLEREPTAPVA